MGFNLVFEGLIKWINCCSVWGNGSVFI